MTAVPKTRSVRTQSNRSGRLNVSSGGTVVTSAGSANALGTKVDLINTTNFETDWVEILFYNNFAAATVTDSLVNIYVGGSGSEQLLIPNLGAGWVHTGWTGAGIVVKRYGFPLRIPSGSVIRADHQSVRISTGVTCIINLFGDGHNDHWCGTKVEAVGAVTASSRGTNILPGTTSDGTFTNLGTTVNEFGFIQPMLCGHSDTTLTDAGWTLDLGVNGVALTGLDEFIFVGDTSERIGNFSMGRYFTLPAGADLEARLQSDTGGGAAENKSVIAYGVY